MLAAAMAQMHSTLLQQHPGKEENDDATPVDDSTAMTRLRLAAEARFYAAEAALATLRRITNLAARAALLVSTPHPDSPELEANLAAATAINATAQEAVDLVQNEASRIGLDIPQPKCGA